MIESRRERIRQLCASMLDDCAVKLADTGSFDVISDYAEPLPVLVIADLLGVPESDVAPLRPRSQDIVKMYEYDRTPQDDGRAQRACEEFSAYVSDLASDPRRRPADDLVTHLAQVESEGERLTERQLVATCVLLLDAGHEATVNGFGNGIVELLAGPDQWDAVVADPWGVAPTASTCAATPTPTSPSVPASTSAWCSARAVGDAAVAPVARRALSPAARGWRSGGARHLRPAWLGFRARLCLSRRLRRRRSDG